MATRWKKELFSPRVYYGTRMAGLYNLDQIREAMMDGSIWWARGIGKMSVTEIAQKLRMEIPEHPVGHNGIVCRIHTKRYGCPILH